MISLRDEFVLNGGSQIASINQTKSPRAKSDRREMDNWPVWRSVLAGLRRGARSISHPTSFSLANATCRQNPLQAWFGLRRGSTAKPMRRRLGALPSEIEETL